MRTFAPSTHFAGRCCRACLYEYCSYCLHERLVTVVCATMSVRPLAPATMPALMHCTFPSLPASSIPGPGASGLQVWPDHPFWLDV